VLVGVIVHDSGRLTMDCAPALWGAQSDLPLHAPRPTKRLLRSLSHTPASRDARQRLNITDSLAIILLVPRNDDAEEGLANEE